jgi:hypothetical protein
MNGSANAANGRNTSTIASDAMSSHKRAKPSAGAIGPSGSAVKNGSTSRVVARAVDQRRASAGAP